MGGGGSKPDRSVYQAPVLKKNEQGGFRLFELNLDRNGDGQGHDSWSIAVIAGLTLIAVLILRWIYVARKKHRARRALKRTAAAAALEAHYHLPPKIPRSAASFPAVTFVDESAAPAATVQPPVIPAVL